MTAETPTRQWVDQRFATVAHGTEAERDRAIDELHGTIDDLLGRKTDEDRPPPLERPLFSYAEEALGGAGQGEDGRKRLANVAKAIPVLIDHLDTERQIKAVEILITIQGHCPPPKEELWRRWWDRIGRAKFSVPENDGAAAG